MNTHTFLPFKILLSQNDIVTSKSTKVRVIREGLVYISLNNSVEVYKRVEKTNATIKKSKGFLDFIDNLSFEDKVARGQKS